MGRQFDGECDDAESWLRACAWGWNEKQALRGKKGVAFLRELEAALLALPEKRLIYREFAVSTKTLYEDKKQTEEGNRRAIAKGYRPMSELFFKEAGVCAIGCVLLKRKIDAGLTREQAEAAIENEMGHENEARDAMDNAAKKLGIKGVLAYAVMEANDDYGEGEETPAEKRYQLVLSWVQKKIKDAADFRRFTT